MLPHRVGWQRKARGGVSSRMDAWAQPGGHRRKMCGGASSRDCMYPRPRVGVRADHTGSQNATRRERNVWRLGTIFREEAQLYRHLCSMDSIMEPARLMIARADPEARPGSERRLPAAGRQPVLSTGGVFPEKRRKNATVSSFSPPSGVAAPDPTRRRPRRRILRHSIPAFWRR